MIAEIQEEALSAAMIRSTVYDLVITKERLVEFRAAVAEQGADMAHVSDEVLE